MGKINIDYKGIVDTIITECDIFPPVDYNKPMPAPIHIKEAMWDTGADVCVISKRLVKLMGLTPISKTDVKGIHGRQLRNTYLVHVKLPTDDLIVNVQAIEDEGEDFDFVIGTFAYGTKVNVMYFGDLAISTFEDNTNFAFRIPAEEHIHF